MIPVYAVGLLDLISLFTQTQSPKLGNSRCRAFCYARSHEKSHDVSHELGLVGNRVRYFCNSRFICRNAEKPL